MTSTVVTSTVATTAATTTAVTTTTMAPSLPVLPFVPKVPSYGGAGFGTPAAERFQRIYDATGLHGPGHDLVTQMLAERIVITLPAQVNEEMVVGCADWAMIDFYRIDEQAERLIQSLSASTGTPPEDITSDQILSVFKAVGVFKFDPAWHKYFILLCAGIPREQAQASAGL